MRYFYSVIINHRFKIIPVFILLAVCCAIAKPMVGVNYDMKAYLPDDAPSTRALNTMNEEYDGNLPNTRIMLRNVTVKEAMEYKAKFMQVDGVTDVEWLDDAVSDVYMPLAMMDQDTLDTYYRADSGDALMKVTVGRDNIQTAIGELQEIAGDRGALAGDAVNTAAATRVTVKEIQKVTVIAIITVLLILLLTTSAWVHAPLVMASLGIAIVINAGSNIIFGEVSFITNAAGTILQLAVSLDYCVFLLHRYTECRRTCADKNSAMTEALCLSTSSLVSSGFTTIIGFMALCLMKYKIGPDLGLALAKGVTISLIVALVFFPCLIITADKAITKTSHRRLLPTFQGLGRGIRRIIVPAAVILIIAAVPAFIISGSNSFFYGPSHIFGSDTAIGQDKDDIDDAFGQMDTYALMVPKGDIARELKLTDSLKQMDKVTAIRSYTSILGPVIPPEIVPDSIAGQLVSDKYTRMAITVRADTDSEATFRLVDTIRNTAADYYGEDYLLAGEGVSTTDLKTTTTGDMLKVNIVAILAVLLVLVIMLRSVLLPVILVLCIETAIWINLSMPYLSGDHVFYFAYLIISAIQLGATVDYAILATNKFREFLAQSLCGGDGQSVCSRKDAAGRAVVMTISSIMPSIITSGGAMITVGFLLGYMSTHQLLAQLGMFIGIGAICSLVIVLTSLMGFLYLLARTSRFKLGDADDKGSSVSL